ncbi:MAG: (deoxy)nucleoside triphosphate pyrophosphohydrolase [Alphaproteobacteria bacterium]
MLPTEVEGCPLLVVVALALFDGDGRVLLQCRPEGREMSGYWEFPGGKIQDGERPEEALGREIMEELGLSIALSCLSPFTFTSYDYGRVHLLLALYVCREWSGVPRGLEGQETRWVRLNEINKLPLLPANVPLVAALRTFL